jgi:nucleoside-diphosphate-sugar epimerase
MPKKIIITGAAGLVGLNLISKLNKKDYSIVAIDKNGANLDLIKKINPSVKVFCADLSQLNPSWMELFKDANCVIQLQAQISDSEKGPYIKNNIDSVKNVVEVCEKLKIKNLIHISSSVVISIAKDNYSNTKKDGEEIVKKSGVPHTILRPSLMYGCFDIKHMGFLMKFLRKVPFVYPIPGNGEYIRQPVYVEDLIDIIIRLIEEKPKNEIWNIIGKEQIYFIDMLKQFAKVEGRNRIFLKIPIPLFLIMLKVYNFLFSEKPFVPAQLNALIAGDIFPVDSWDEKFHVRYTPFEEGVKKTVNSELYQYYKIMKK